MIQSISDLELVILPAFRLEVNPEYLKEVLKCSNRLTRKVTRKNNSSIERNIKDKVELIILSDEDSDNVIEMNPQRESHKITVAKGRILHSEKSIDVYLSYMHSGLVKNIEKIAILLKQSQYVEDLNQYSFNIYPPLGYWPMKDCESVCVTDIRVANMDMS